MKSAIKTAATTWVIFAAITLVAIGGYVANIFKLVGMVGGDITAMFVMRIVGIFAAPLGAVLGFF